MPIRLFFSKFISWKSSSVINKTPRCFYFSYSFTLCILVNRWDTKHIVEGIWEGEREVGDNISEEVRRLKQVLNTLWPWVIWRCSSHFHYLWNLVGEQDGYPTHKPRWDAGENGGKTPVPTGEVQWSHSEQQQGYQEVRACGGQKLGDLEVSIDG